METIEVAFQPAMIGFTILFGLMLIIWMLIILGMFDLDFLDFDIGGEVSGTDIGAGADLDIDANVAPDAGGVFHTLLAFFYIGQVPVLILFTILISSMWILGVVANFNWNPSGQMAMGLPIAIGVVATSLLTLKIIALPFRIIFSLIQKNYDPKHKILGNICVVISEKIDKKLGQAQITSHGTTLVINCVSDDGKPILKNEEAVILSMDKKDYRYRIAPVRLD